MSKKAALSRVKVLGFGSGGAGGVDHIVRSGDKNPAVVLRNRVPECKADRTGSDEIADGGYIRRKSHTHTHCT